MAVIERFKDSRRKRKERSMERARVRQEHKVEDNARRALRNSKSAGPSGGV